MYIFITCNILIRIKYLQFYIQIHQAYCLQYTIQTPTQWNWRLKRSARVTLSLVLRGWKDYQHSTYLPHHSRMSMKALLELSLSCSSYEGAWSKTNRWTRIRWYPLFHKKKEGCYVNLKQVYEYAFCISSSMSNEHFNWNVLY